MKKCPKCGRTYDDSWGVCINCNVQLSKISPSQMTEAMENHEKIKTKQEEEEEDIKRHALCVSQGRRFLNYILDMIFMMILFMPVSITATLMLITFGLSQWEKSVDFIFFIFLTLLIILSLNPYGEKVRRSLLLEQKLLCRMVRNQPLKLF